MDIHFKQHNGRVDELVEELVRLAGVHHPAITREMVLSALAAGQEIDYLADLKLMRTTLKEMSFTSRLFGGHRGRKKVTIFGSARTTSDSPIYEKCVRFARLLADKGYMVITGGGGGIMQAGNEGAGAENSFAVNIRLPHEQETNPVMSQSPNVITYKYFFNRKVAFLKEAAAVALFPGGFGTLDEAMETLTLIQTGKNPPIPLVLIDDDQGDYWERVLAFMKDPLLKRDLISGEDFSLFSITRDPAEAVAIIDAFYRVYHSMRFVGKTLVIRLNKPLSREQIEILESEFPEIKEPESRLQLAGPLPAEKDQPDLLPLPRLTFEFNRRSYGLLLAFIRRLNTF
ncbi:Rossmann fold nucleotide-binding protein [Syntrophotalea carbinolica DSM 2380]|uniref:AMP nucleosidase n=1 Tax=Syntrophotalea carbinolica (strain DSM 2380 / NBRC 103641 / GraBd1) TaxID=338963 RepID=Q3A147_SYNC1|nr:LOG family protein [Syntrophotalea carbinolica]ABA89910.1 Rossmann fold nucleotide-binding protein [Syntrophotalea carbinolica DSM 2380]